jgi:hypothetical protein
MVGGWVQSRICPLFSWNKVQYVLYHTMDYFMDDNFLSIVIVRLGNRPLLYYIDVCRYLVAWHVIMTIALHASMFMWNIVHSLIDIRKNYNMFLFLQGIWLHNNYATFPMLALCKADHFLLFLVIKYVAIWFLLWFIVMS